MAGFASLADLVKNYESGGDYQATNPGSTASGAYQFINSTWLQYAGAAGIDTRQYPTAGSAPASAQDAVFNQAVAANGLGDWTCAGCNPKLSAYLASNPSAYNLPVQAGGGGGVSGSAPTAAPGAASSSPGAAPASSSPAASASFYVIAVILVVFLLAAGLWGLIKG